jgi:hypothetical protein
MNPIDNPGTANGHVGLNHGRTTTKGGSGPRSARARRWAAEQIPRQATGGRDDGDSIWKVTYVNAGSSSEHGLMTAVFDSESDFRSFLEYLGSNGSTVIVPERTSVTGWEVQQ